MPAVSPMTWKAYTAVSGATVLAGWLASAPPSSAPGTSGPAPNQAAPGRAAAQPDIAREAARLTARARREAAYTLPQRNLFRFGAARPMASRGTDIPEPAPPAETPAPSLAPPPAVSLSGIAEDPIEQRIDRTAILSSRDDVLLVREGDTVLGEYRVTKIESEAIELLRIVDGTTLRLTLKP